MVHQVLIARKLHQDVQVLILGQLGRDDGEKEAAPQDPLF
jgi:hypothetical protein